MLLTAGGFFEHLFVGIVGIGRVSVEHAAFGQVRGHLAQAAQVSFAAALTPGGVKAVMELDGALNAASFASYLAQVLGPTLVVGDVLVLDNPPVHKTAGLAALVGKRGVRRLFLPLYSPDFTPIELAFSKRKTYLRSAARSRIGHAPMAPKPGTNGLHVGIARLLHFPAQGRQPSRRQQAPVARSLVSRYFSAPRRCQACA